MAIKVSNVNKSFKEVQAVKNLNLEISSGESVALLGPNGAGKTTLVEMIQGVQHPDSGEIQIRDETQRQTSKNNLSPFYTPPGRNTATACLSVHPFTQ